MAETKKNILTYEGLKALEDELHELKVNRRLVNYCKNAFFSASESDWSLFSRTTIF